MNLIFDSGRDEMRLILTKSDRNVTFFITMPVNQGPSVESSNVRKCYIEENEK